MVTKIERVRSAFKHKELDRIPMGEWGLGLAEETTKDILGDKYDGSLALQFKGSWTLPFNSNNIRSIELSIFAF